MAERPQALHKILLSMGCTALQQVEHCVMHDFALHRLFILQCIALRGDEGAAQEQGGGLHYPMISFLPGGH